MTRSDIFTLLIASFWFVAGIAIGYRLGAKDRAPICPELPELPELQGAPNV